jgi:DNA invertase Pin-like site-specific DNA recombinase
VAIEPKPGLVVRYDFLWKEEQRAGIEDGKDRPCAIVLTSAEKADGSKDVHAGLADALARCAAGDVLVVWKLDRLGRSLLDLVVLVEALQARGAGLKILTGQGAQLDTTKPDGRMIFGILAIMAQFERELIAERTKAGLASAKRRGVQLGRPPLLSPFQIEEARKMIAAGKLRREVAELLGVSPLTLRRALSAAAMPHRPRGPEGQPLSARSSQ